MDFLDAEVPSEGLVGVRSLGFRVPQFPSSGVPGSRNRPGRRDLG